jgi:imidazole glycerol phosphate synthase subunit HisF
MKTKQGERVNLYENPSNLLEQTSVQAALAAGLFHRKEMEIEHEAILARGRHRRLDHVIDESR